MRKISTDDLRQKEIVNLCDGAKLGYACDFEFDTVDGHICALIVPRGAGFLGFSRECDLVIPWCKIECIGEDAILVKLPKEDFLSCECKEGKRRKGSR